MNADLWKDGMTKLGWKRATHTLNAWTKRWPDPQGESELFQICHIKYVGEPVPTWVCALRMSWRGGTAETEALKGADPLVLARHVEPLVVQQETAWRLGWRP